MKNIFIIEFYNYSPILETGLEIAQRELIKKNNVSYFFLGHSVIEKDSRMIFPYRKKNNFILNFIAPEKKGCKLLSKYKNFNFDLNLKLKNYSFSIPKFKNIEQIKNFWYENFDVGFSAYYLSLNSNNQNQFLLKNLILSALNVSKNLEIILKKKKPDIVYIYNSRFIHNRAIYFLCKKLKIKCLIYERGPSLKKFKISDLAIHDKKNFENKINLYWKKFKNKKKYYNMVNSFFNDRINDIFKLQNDISFSRGKNLNFLTNDKIIAYFTSSKEEVDSVSEEYLTYFKNESLFIKNLLKIAKFKNFKVLIKIHPNLINKDSSYLEYYRKMQKKFQKENIVFVMPDSRINPYSIIKKSKIIITAGSTVGYEATYLKKKSISISPCVYDFANLTFVAKNFSQLKKIINSNDTNKFSIRNFAKYIFYTEAANNYFNYKFFKYDKFAKNTIPYSGKFNNINLNKKSLFVKLLNKLFKIN